MRYRKVSEEEENGYYLYKRKNGYWYYIAYDRNGKRFQRSTGKKNQTAANAVCVGLAIEKKLVSEAPVGKKILFRDFARDFYIYDRCPYIQGRLARGFTYQRKTADCYRYYVEQYVFPVFGEMMISRITFSDVNGWLLSMPERFVFSNKTANTILGLMKQILQTAIEKGVIKENVAAAVKPLAKSKGEERRVPFTRVQVRMILHYGCTGMRVGEICAIEAENVFPDHILVRASYNNRKDGLKSTKSGYERVVPINGDIYGMLMSMKEEGKRFLFSLNGIDPPTPDFIESRLRKAMKDLGIKAKPGTILSFHSFRHFFNSRLKADGMDNDKVQAVIGHESDQMTDHYTHLELDDLKQVSLIQKTIWTDVSV